MNYLENAYIYADELSGKCIYMQMNYMYDMQLHTQGKNLPKHADIGKSKKAGVRALITIFLDLVLDF